VPYLNDIVVIGMMIPRSHHAWNRWWSKVASKIRCSTPRRSDPSLVRSLLFMMDSYCQEIIDVCLSLSAQVGEVCPRRGRPPSGVRPRPRIHGCGRSRGGRRGCVTLRSSGCSRAPTCSKCPSLQPQDRGEWRPVLLEDAVQAAVVADHVDVATCCEPVGQHLAVVDEAVERGTSRAHLVASGWCVRIGHVEPSLGVRPRARPGLSGAGTLFILSAQGCLRSSWSCDALEP
jgi:hypothetical protein